MTKNERRIFLGEVKEVLDKHKIEFWLESGTLLGAIRDKDFIEWDKDIDISIKRINQHKVTEILQELKDIGGKIGYSMIQTSTYKPYLDGHHVFKDGFKIDVYYWCKIKEGYIAYTNTRVISLNPAKHYDTLDTIDFLGMEVKVPHNPEEYLTGVYGEDWRVVNKNWNEDLQKNLKPLEKYDKYFY